MEENLVEIDKIPTIVELKSSLVKGDIKYIYQISDIHIRNNNDRHQEYRNVFEKLFEKLGKKNIGCVGEKKSSVLVICGDLLMEKSTYTAECMTLLKEFLQKLTEIIHVIIIAGNHDAILSNEDRMDSISGIIYGCNFQDRLHYLKYTGAYRLNNVVFSVKSVLDKKPIIKANNIITENPKEIKVALYHGMLNQAVLNNNQIVSSKIGIKDFENYDLVLLGDIHKFQYLNSKKTICYCGSLLQQNFGETIDHHGYVKWNLDTLESKFIEVENTHVFITLTICDDNYELSLPNYVNSGSARIRYKNIESDFLEKICHQLQGKGINIIEKEELNIMEENKFHNLIGNIYDDTNIEKNIEEMLKRYKKNKMLNTNDLLNGVLEHHKQLVHTLDTAVFNSKEKLTWNLKKLEFSNIMSYGENNVIDFENKKGVIGILGNNGNGKSTLVYTIIYAIWGVVVNIRQDLSNLLLNKNKNYFHTKVKISIGDDIYIIERRAEKGTRLAKTGIKGLKSTSVKVTKIDVDGKTHDLTKDKVVSTNNYIKNELIGDLDFYLKTSLSIQNNNMGIINLSGKEKKELLSSILNFETFDQLKNINDDSFKKKIKKRLIGLENILETTKAKLYNITQENLDEDYAKRQKYKAKIESLDQEINHTLSQINNAKVKDYEKMKEDIKQISNNINKLKIDITKNEQKLNYDIKDTQEYDNSISYLQNQKENNLQNKIPVKMINETQKEKDKEIANNLKKELNIDSLDNYEKIYQEFKDELQEFKDQIIFNKKIKEKNMTYNDNCQQCQENKALIFDSLNDNGKNIEKIKQKILDCEKLKDILEKIKEYEINDQSQEKNYQIDLEIKKLEIEIDKLKNDKNIIHQLQLLKNDMKVLIIERNVKDNEIKECEENMKIIKTNKKLSEKVDTLIERKKEIIEELENLEEIIKKKEFQNQKYLETSIELEKTQVEYNEKSIKYEIFEAYDYCMDINGIRALILNDTISYIETNVNNVLMNIVDFKINIKYDLQSILIFKIESNGQYLIDNASGFETWITSLAFRIAFRNICQIPKSNFFLQDEGFGSMDNEHMSLINNVFEYMKKYYDFCLIISHIESLKDYYEIRINVTKDEYSTFVIE